jgi:hypothetical protein
VFNLPFDAATGVALLPYGYFPAGVNIGAAKYADISVSLYCDEGASGFGEVGATSDLFAIQLFAGLGRGNYLVPATFGGLSESTGAVVASGSLFELTSFSEANGAGSFKYQSRLHAFIGRSAATYNFSITKDGLLGSDGSLITVKRLTYKNSIAAVSDEPMYGYNAEVNLVELAAGPGAATATFKIRNANRLPYNGALYAELYSESGSVPIDSQRATASVNIGDAAEQTFNFNINALNANTVYRFRVWTYADSGASAKVYLYDSELSATGPYYKFQTIGSVDVGETTASVIFSPLSYDDRAVLLTYSLNQTLGFRMYYSIKNLRTGTVYNDTELAGILGILPSAAGSAAPTKNVRLKYAEGNTFWEAGVSYEISAVASTQTHSGIISDGGAGYLGGKTFAFTMPGLSRPSFSAAVTPGYSADNYSLTVNTLDMDADKVITGNGKYMLRIFDSAGVDVTPTAPIDLKNTLYYADDKPGAPGLVTFDGLAASEQYTLRWYAVANTENAANPAEIDNVSPAYFLYGNKTYVIYEAMASTTDAHGIYVGRVSAGAGLLNRIRLTFSGSVKLTDVKRIQYAIIRSGSTGNRTGKVDFVPSGPTGDNMYTFELPPEIIESGEYTVTLRFYTTDNAGKEVYIDQPVSIYYYK